MTQVSSGLRSFTQKSATLPRHDELDVEAGGRLMPRTGRPPKHPWDEWLDGQVHRLAPDRDFDVATEVMRTQILNEARRRELTVRTRTKQGWIEISGVEPRKVDRPKRTRFDWDAIFAKNPAALERGDDFDCEPQAFAARARQAAYRRRLSASIQIGGGVVVIRTH